MKEGKEYPFPKLLKFDQIHDFISNPDSKIMKFTYTSPKNRTRIKENLVQSRRRIELKTLKINKYQIHQSTKP